MKLKLGDIVILGTHGRPEVIARITEVGFNYETVVCKCSVSPSIQPSYQKYTMYCATYMYRLVSNDYSYYEGKCLYFNNPKHYVIKKLNKESYRLYKLLYL